MFQDLHLSGFIKGIAWIYAALMGCIVCLVLFGLYLFNHSVLEIAFSKLPQSEKGGFFPFYNPLINIFFLGIASAFGLFSVRFLQLAQFDKPYLSVRPNGLRLNDLPFMSAGMITWDNIAAIENPPFPLNLNKSALWVRLKDPTKFRFYPTSSERFINAILRIASLGFYKGPYLQRAVPLQSTAEMSVAELRELIIEKSGVQPKIKYQKPRKATWSRGRLALPILFTAIVVMVIFRVFNPTSEISEPRTDFAFVKLNERAEAGDARSQHLLAWRYYRGHGVAKNKEAAFTWWMKAAKQGYTRSESDVGWAYRKGHGVKQDYTQAFEWFMKAAEKDHTYVQSNIGWLYAKGHGTKRDYEKAFYWYKKAADKGNTHSESWIGWLYETGKGVEKNRDLAIEYYERAAAKKHKYSIKALKRLKG